MSLADELLADLEDLESDEEPLAPSDDEEEVLGGRRRAVGGGDDDDSDVADADDLGLDSLVTTSVRTIAKLRDSAKVRAERRGAARMAAARAGLTGRVWRG